MSEGGREEGRKVSEGGRGGGSELLTCWGGRRGAGTAIGGLWYCRLATRVEHMSHRKLCRTDEHTPGRREGGKEGEGGGEGGEEGGGEGGEEGGGEGRKEDGGRDRGKERGRERRRGGGKGGRRDYSTRPVH